MGCMFALVLLPLLLLSGHITSSAPAAAATGMLEPRWILAERAARRPAPLTEIRSGFLYSRGRGRCTPQFWSSRREAWPKMIPHDASIWKVFGSRALERYEPELTVLEATQRNDDIGGSAFAQLVKQSSAALLNAYTRKGFPYTAWEVKTLLIQALVTEEAARSQARLFAQANQACT